MPRLAALNFLLVAMASHAVAGPAVDLATSTIYLYADTACSSLDYTFTIDDVFKNCHNIGPIQSYQIGGVAGCSETQPGFNKEFSLFATGDSTCTVAASSNSRVVGGGCGAQTGCQVTKNPGDNSAPEPAYAIIASSVQHGGTS